MKVVNADYGIDSVAMTDKYKWYYWHRFPLLPIFSHSKPDEWNERNFSFSWLNIRLWTMMSPDIGIGVTIEDIGGYVDFRVPYLKGVVWFLWFPSSWHQKLWRTGTKKD